MKKPNFREDGIFHDIREWIFNNVIDDSLMNIPDYVASPSNVNRTPKEVRGPLNVC